MAGDRITELDLLVDRITELDLLVKLSKKWAILTGLMNNPENVASPVGM